MSIFKESRGSKVLMAIGITGIWLSGCLDNSSDSDVDDDYLQVVTTQTHGNVLADEEGNVLYFFARDVSGESMCEGNCLTNWPVFHSENYVPAGGLLQAEDIGTITREDGSSQTVYNGWPLYYFANDTQPGDINGDGAGDVWYVARTNYSLMKANAQLVGADGNNYTSDYEVGEGNTTYFTDAEGRTLYRFIHDEANTNNYTEGDFSNNDNWPIFYTEDLENLPSGMNEEDFGEITVHGEQQQLTYKGWPLYYFGGDEERGDTRGVSVPQPGVWPIANADIPEAP